VPAQPRQIEFARLNLTYTVMSKRKLLQLVKEGHVNGWDDPRMPTLSGLRRRGFTPASIRNFCATIGLTKKNSTTDVALLEHAVREDLNRTAPRYMAVLNPLRIVIENLPEDHAEQLQAVLNPEDPGAGSRLIPFGREFFIERDDFMEDPPKKFFRLGPGREVRLRYAYTFTCTGFDKDPATGEVTLLRGTIDPETLGKNPEGRKVSGVIHWVPAAGAVEAEIRLYDRLFLTPDPDDAEGGFLSQINPDSLKTLRAMLEPAGADLPAETNVQFERVGYFVTDRRDHGPGTRPVFNRTVALKDSWAKTATKDG
jgi:glutaminyl-tRNA synthetase